MSNKEFICKRCGKKTIRRTSQEKYCDECKQPHRKEYNKERSKKDWLERKDRAIGYQKKYYSKIENLEKCRRKSKERYNKIKQQIFDLLGNQCSNPYNLNHGDFMSDIRCLQIDHVNGNGYEERHQKSRSYKYLHVLKKILAGSKDYQLLCANCNFIKVHENKEHPHNKST